ncbi:MAG TPA: MFS transporter [Actinomycetota bacterium]|nr:MFS transporter [Actinomycetota bacterium]
MCTGRWAVTTETRTTGLAYADRHGIRRQAASFWLLALLLALAVFSATAPSPLYAVYRARFGFSALTLTAIYAVYALGALAALLIFGRLSDHIGRRSVVALGLVLLMTSMGVFIAADGVAPLYVARVVQGMGAGIASGAINAWLLDLQPHENPRFGGLVGGVALIAGLGAGALGSGLLVQYAPNPLDLIYWLLAALYVAGLVSMPFIPDVVERRAGALASMRPQVGVPRVARQTFAALTPSMIAIWALGGLFASLGPSLALTLLQTSNRVAGGAVIAALFLTSAAASAVFRGAEPRAMVTRGSLMLMAGVGLTLVAAVIESPIALYAGSIVAGIGFGPAFSGVIRTLTVLAPPDKRGALVAAIYIVIYVSFSVPTVLAGLALARFPLRETTYVYGVIVMALAGATTVAVARRKTIAEANQVPAA